MMAAIDQILAAVEAQLAGIAGSNGVYRKPFFLLDESDLDCIVIDEISDEKTGSIGYWPKTETHVLSFNVEPVVMAKADLALPKLGVLHAAVIDRLFGSIDMSRLGGLLGRSMDQISVSFFSDAESLQFPVCGWRIRVTCTYNTRSDLPGLIDKES